MVFIFVEQKEIITQCTLNFIYVHTCVGACMQWHVHRGQVTICWFSPFNHVGLGAQTHVIVLGSALVRVSVGAVKHRDQIASWGRKGLFDLHSHIAVH